MDSILKGSLWELVRPHSSPDVVAQLRVTARCGNIGEKYEPFGAFFISLLKFDRRGEKSPDMVKLRTKDMLRDWMRHAATDGWCADWACVTPATTTISVHHTCEDHDEDTVHLENHEMLANTVEWRSTVLCPRGFRRH